MKQRVLALALMLCGGLVIAEPAFARHRTSFVPGHHGYARSGWHGSHGARRYGRHSGASRSQHAGIDEGGGPPPPPGSGFKMEDGVLTYPAPARFQPKNLKHLGQ